MSISVKWHCAFLAATSMLLLSGAGLCQETSNATERDSAKKEALVTSLRQANPDFQGAVQVAFDKDGAIVSVRIQADQTVKDLSPLKGLPLKSFAITNAAITDIEPLRGMKLTNVALMKCENLTDISPLQDMPLRNATLYASRKLQDISPLKNAKLRSVNCEATSVSDLTPLAGQPIYNARLCSRKIKDISPLKGNQELRILDISFAHEVTDLKPLKEMPNVRDLRMDEAKVSDLTPLTHLEDLLLLSVKDCPNVKDLSPLKGLKNLKVLVFTPRNFSAAQIKLVREELTTLEFIDADYRNWNNRNSLNPSADKPVCTPAGEFWKRYDAGEFTAARGEKRTDAPAPATGTRTTDRPSRAGNIRTDEKPLNQEMAVRADVVVREDPTEFEISWMPVKNGANAPIEIYRRTDLSGNWGEPVATLPPGTLSFTDRDSLNPGVKYEYRIKTGTNAQNTSYGYLAVGAKIPAVEDRGKVLLVIDETMAAGLATEIDRLKRDLVGDGWQVTQRTVPRDVSKGIPYHPGDYGHVKGVTPTAGDPAEVVRVREMIQAEYKADPQNLKAVFLLGRVPQPYSGNRAFDTHKEHIGAWPTDAYYADLDGEWTDSTADVNYIQEIRGKKFDSRNRNHPGDYRWDQNKLPSDVELQVGRVDLWGFEESRITGPQPKSELELLRQYLDKDHNFRHNKLKVERRGLISDGYNRPGFCFALTGWMGFSSLFGKEHVKGFHQTKKDNWMNELKERSYLCGLACGYGTEHGVSDIGIKYGLDGPGSSGTGRFLQWDPRVVFVFMSGSWFSDYDKANNFLRAPLASKTYGLTNTWSGTPLYLIHHMALGGTIGEAYRLSHNQDNNAESGYRHYHLFDVRGITASLHGDPTLRLHPVTPPSNVSTMVVDANQVLVKWSGSQEPIAGYRVYRSKNEFGPYERISPEEIQSTEFTDKNPVSGQSFYMVRAIKLEQSGSGTYYNPSQGAFSSVVTIR